MGLGRACPVCRDRPVPEATERGVAGGPHCAPSATCVQSTGSCLRSPAGCVCPARGTAQGGKPRVRDPSQRHQVSPQGACGHLPVAGPGPRHSARRGGPDSHPVCRSALSSPFSSPCRSCSPPSSTACSVGSGCSASATCAGRVSSAVSPSSACPSPASRKYRPLPGGPRRGGVPRGGGSRGDGRPLLSGIGDVGHRRVMPRSVVTCSPSKLRERAVCIFIERELDFIPEMCCRQDWGQCPVRPPPPRRVGCGEHRTAQNHLIHTVPSILPELSCSCENI